METTTCGCKVNTIELLAKEEGEEECAWIALTDDEPDAGYVGFRLRREWGSGEES